MFGYHNFCFVSLFLILIFINQGAAKGRRQKEFDHFSFFGTLSVTFWSLFCHCFRHLFCQAPFAGLLLRQGEL